MRLRAVLMLLLALFMGATAVFLARSWLFNQLSAVRTTIQQPAPKLQLGTIVVAAGPLRFGQKIEKSSIKTIDWPVASVPAGAFKKVDELLGEQPRMVLQAMEENEPVLAGKITGPGARATLSAIIGQGMRALTLRVNDVLGVAGFVLPGDRVDILLTRVLEKDTPPVTDVLMQNIKVLGVDQEADQKADKPLVVKAATFEVTTEEAQKLVLASQVGTLSLALRGVATVKVDPAKRVHIGDLNVGQANDVPPPAAEPPKPPPVTFTRIDPLSVIGITRGMSRQEYRVLPSGGVVLPGMPEPLPPGQPPAGEGAPGQPSNQGPPGQSPAGAQPGAGQPGGSGPPGGAPGQPGAQPAPGNSAGPGLPPPTPLGPTTSVQGGWAPTPS
jgi:pilus assembly protein CpaB